MIVLDASAAVDLLLRNRAGLEVELLLLEAELDAHAPQLIDAEVAGALRRKERRAELRPERAAQSLEVYRDLPLALYPVRPLLDRAWRLRGNLTIADGLYVALAEALGTPLLTTDARAARAARAIASVDAVVPAPADG